ncbi:MAG: hypothetical protein NTU88_12590, partial [Armatimonadetes bacterium]|nr:hypothetical protein [Armatimonadota bacterium]
SALMPNGNGKTAALVLSIVLGAATIASTTAAIIGWGEARRTEKLDEETKEWKKTEYAPFKSDYDTLKGQILAELKNLGKGQDDLKKLFTDYVQGR